MIARMWHGIVQQNKSDDYYEILKKTGYMGLTATEGNLGVYIMRRDENESTHFMIISLWDSFESIKKFAGENYEKAYYYPEDDKFLKEKEPYVKHWQILEQPGDKQ